MAKEETKNYVRSKIYTNGNHEVSAQNTVEALDKMIDDSDNVEQQVATLGSKVGEFQNTLRINEQKDGLYITDADGNIITKINKDGLSTTAVKLLKDGRLNDVLSLLEEKVDKESGKSLSTNDYTTADKNKVATIDNKVDKEEGKGLSTNDLTNELKAKILEGGSIKSISEEQKDAFYIVDKDGNVIGKVDSDGMHSTDFEYLEDGEMVKLSDKLKNLSVEGIQNLYPEGLYITDGRGYLLAKFTKDGVDYVGKQGGGGGASVKYDSGETRTDIVYNIFYGRSLSYHGTIASGVDMHTCLQFDTTDGGYMMLGITEEMVDDKEALDAFFKGIIPSKTGISGTGIAHANRKFMELLNEENGIDIKFDDEGNPNYYFQLLGANPGVVTGSSGLMNLNGLPYKRLLKSVEYAKKFAELQNKSFSVGAVCYMEGEEVNTYKQRYDYLWAFASSVDHDIRQITGQENHVYLMPYQMGSHACKFEYGIGIPNAQLQIALDEGTVEGYVLESAAQSRLREGVSLIDRKYIQLGAIMCSLNYASETDHVHATQHSYLAAGSQWGVQLKRTLYDKNPLKPIHVISHKVSMREDGKYILALQFHVPVRPLVFDLSNEDCQSQRATSPYYGFSLDDSEGNNIIDSVYLRRGQEVLIVANSNPSGLTLYYAKDGWETGGNLRDSQDLTYSMGGFIYKIHNWCPIFSMEIN